MYFSRNATKERSKRRHDMADRGVHIEAKDGGEGF